MQWDFREIFPSLGSCKCSNTALLTAKMQPSYEEV